MMQGINTLAIFTLEPVDDFFTTYAVPIRIMVIIVAAILLRIILVAIIQHTAHRVANDAKRRRERIRAAKEAGHKPPKQFPLSPLAAERVVQRTRALASLGRNIITVAIITVAIFMILGELAVNLTAVLASAGILAAGLAFGAQNIVKDLLNGIFMVAEDQLGVGDSVVIGDIEGIVEVVGLRITQVRAHDGTLWFIRNGEILRLGNLSHGWGRAVLDVSVAANSDLDRVAEVIAEAARHVSRSRELIRKVIGVPEIVPGLIEVNEDRATLQVSVQTVAEAQGEVELALRREIKTAFDREGIRFAPQQTAIIIRGNTVDEL